MSVVFVRPASVLAALAAIAASIAVAAPSRAGAEESARKPPSTESPARGAPSAPAVVAGMASGVDAAESILARFEHEPKVGSVQEEAARFAGTDPKRAASWQSRVRKAPWLPELSVRVLRGMEDDLLSNANGQTHAVSDDLAIEVRARWRFDRLVFDRNELSVSRETTSFATLRHDVVAEATRLYFQRRRLQVDLALSPPRTAEARARRLLQLSELTAELDALTGGWFRRQLGRTEK